MTNSQTPIFPPVTSFFSNKIPTTFDDWFDTLVAVASVYDKFDGRVYNRSEIIKEFAKIATRNVTTTRDPSDFRDEYGAYGSYLGIFFVERGPDGRLICRMSRTAKQLLCGHDPDPEAFCRLQMALYQYPDGTGILYQSGAARMQANSLSNKTKQIKEGVLFAPFRVVLQFLLYFHDRGSRPDAYLTYEEIFFLFNRPEVHARDASAVPAMAEKLLEYRRAGRGLQSVDANFKRNFHILERTGLIGREMNRMSLDLSGNREAKLNAARTIAGLGEYFRDFNSLSGGHLEKQITDIILGGKWGRYFDAVNTLHYDAVSGVSDYEHQPPGEEAPGAARFPQTRKYRLFRFPGSVPQPEQRIPAEPDYARTNELREKRNARHREINDMLAKKIISLGSDATDNEFVDMIAKLSGRDFIFEVKTATPSDVLVRVREAVSQLFEYKYRSQGVLNDPKLALLLEIKPPQEYAWLENYLKFLGVILCWTSGDKICSRRENEPALGRLVNEYC